MGPRPAGENILVQGTGQPQLWSAVRGMCGRRAPLSGWSEEVIYKQRQAWKGRKSVINAAGAARDNVLRLMGREDVTMVQEEEEGLWVHTDGREELAETSQSARCVAGVC